MTKRKSTKKTNNDLQNNLWSWVISNYIVLFISVSTSTVTWLWKLKLHSLKRITQ